MTDDKVIEAALDAWFSDEHDRWRSFSEQLKGKLFDTMRAALAAADKVRAGKDKRFINERAENVSLKVGIEDLMAENERLRAGLVKGEAERAALLAFIRAIAHNESDPSEPVADNGMTVWDCIRKDALALVRKGVCNAQRS